MVFLDDFVGAEPPAIAGMAFVRLDELLSVLGAAESVAKACPPHTQMLFIGVWFNSVTMTMEISPERLAKIMAELPSWMEAKRVSRKDIECLVGTLSFVAKCVRPSRIFLSRMLDEMRGMPRTGRHALSNDFKQDVYWWYKFMPQYNGISVIPRPLWSPVNSVVATDACLSGCGGVKWFSREYFHAEFPASIMAMNLSINNLELLAIMVAVKIWGHQLRSQKLKIHCDNTTAVAAMNLARLRNKHMQACMREIAYWSARFECDIWAVHIEGVHNELPDLLSRWHLGPRYSEAFHNQNQGWVKHEAVISEDLFHFSGQWV